jgi:death-on-curing protein
MPFTRIKCDNMVASRVSGHENALESALARPKQKWSYEGEGNMAILAAAYGFGLASNHPYRDGSKRIAFLAI